MKSARLVFAVFALMLTAGWAVSSYACDKDKASTASTKKMKSMAITAAHEGGACTAEMAAKCTPEMAAACKASMKTSAVTAQANNHCGVAKATAVTAQAKASDHCGGMKATAVTAAAEGEADHCGAKATTTAARSARTAAVVASSGASCAAKSATAVSASAAGAKDCCATKDAATTSAKRAQKAMRISASLEGGQCGGTGMAGIASPYLHDNCEACLDMASCSADLDAAGAQRQVVRLKNGLMLVYTADSPARVNAVQAAVSTRGDQLVRFASAGATARLCGECKTIRGAIASGKMSREVVNIEGGTLTLLTSEDAGLIARIHAMSDQKVAARIKS